MADDLIVTDEAIEDPLVLKRLLSDIIERLPNAVDSIVTPEQVTKLGQILVTDQSVVVPTVQDGGITTAKIAPDAVTAQVLSAVATGGSGSLTGDTAGTNPDEETLVSVSIDTTDGSELLIEWTGLFDETARGGTASSKAVFITAIGPDSQTIYSSAHGGIPIPATQFQLGGAVKMEGTGATETIGIKASALALAAGTATWSYNYSNLQLVVTELLR